MKKIFDKYKYPLIILLLGFLFLLIPESPDIKSGEYNDDFLLQQVLACSEGVGEAKLISSENGVVICCQGAGDARVRLDIIRAVGSYTGFGSDKITILKMKK